MLKRAMPPALGLLMLAALLNPPRAAAALDDGSDPIAFTLTAEQRQAFRGQFDRIKRELQVSRAASDIGADGTILWENKYELPSFEKSGFLQTEKIRRYYATVIHKQYAADARTTDIREIAYRSDGLKIRGFILEPKDVPQGAKLPILIFNHGGNRNFDTLGVTEMSWLAKYARKGYIVLASQYRGCERSDGMDEFGGGDVHDVVNLIKAAKSLPDADASRIFMMGHSRGGMETYLAMRADPEIRAAAVMSGECDLKAGLESRPEMETGVFLQIIPGYAQGKERVLRHRSACDWPKLFHAPVYILQGSDDEAVDPEQATELAQDLEKFRKPYKLEMFPGGHNLWFFDENADAVARKIDAWFRAH